MVVKPAERKLLEILINQATVRRLMMVQMTEEDYEGLRTAQLFRLIFEFEQQGMETSYHNLSRALEDEDLARDLLPALLMSDLGELADEFREPLEAEAKSSLERLREERVAEETHRLRLEIRREQPPSNTATELTDKLLMQQYELAKRNFSREK
jgi:hypothetical protein